MILKICIKHHQVILELLYLPPRLPLCEGTALKVLLGYPRSDPSGLGGPKEELCIVSRAWPEEQILSRSLVAAVTPVSGAWGDNFKSQQPGDSYFGCLPGMVLGRGCGVQLPGLAALSQAG